MSRAGFPRALQTISPALAEIFAMPAPMTPSSWATKNLRVPDGPRAGNRWDPTLTPYVAPIIDEFGPEGAINFGVCRKSAQTGISVAGIALCASYIDRAPCKIGYAVQTLEARSEFNREKLNPTIQQTPVLRRKIRRQTSRQADGSTERSKKFLGGSLSLINANSASDLRARTLKVGIADEIDAWADELGEDGEPLELFKGRFMSFHATGDWRLFALSTPTELGISRVDRLFREGDQRFWHVRCPQCDGEIVFEFKYLKFDRKPPYAAHYIAQCCGRPIEHHEKASLVRAGRFVPTNAEGLYPSWHVDALISQLTTWDKLAEAWWAAQGDEKKLKVFFNNWLGLAFEIRGDAPDHIRLLERKGGYEQGRIPPRGLLFVAGCDVQHSGIWYELVAFAANGESWSIQHGFCEGDTTDPERGAFAELARVLEAPFADAFGRMRTLDAVAIDAGDGGRANQVLAFARGRPRMHAIKGVSGWSAPALGTPSIVEITLAGKKIPRGATLWPVGTWSLKATWYSKLRKNVEQDGFPPGYCHFHDGCDERYFRQVTSEYLATTTFKGRTVRAWKETGPNHLLDCRIYAMAMADYLGLSRMTSDEWALLERDRGRPAEAPDLFAAEPLKLQTEIPRAPELAPGADPIRSTSWIAPRRGWLKGD